MKKFHVVSVCAGAALLLFLLWKIGIGQLWREITALGWGLIPLILMEGIVDVLHAVAWRYCLSGSARSLPFTRVFRIRMAGFAINFLTPTAALGGEVTKGALLSQDHQGVDAVSGVLIGKLSFAAAQLLFVSCGALLVVSRIQLPRALWIAMVVSSGLLALGLIGFYLVQKYGKLGSLVRWLVERNVGGKFLGRLEGEISGVDGALQTFYRQHPWSLLVSVFWHLAGFAVGILQTWFFLHLLARDGSLPVAAAIWILGTWFDLLTFAMPSDIGVQEGTRVIAFKALGFDLITGMTYGVVLRLQQIFWAVFGLLNYALLVAEGKPKRPLAARGGDSALALLGYRRGRE